jgi:hypothetical protein
MLLAFCFLALLIGISGSSGLYFVERIRGSVDTLSSFSAPLVRETQSLVESRQKMHVSMLEALLQQDASRDQGYRDQLTELDGLTQRGFEALNGLSRAADIDLDIASASAPRPSNAWPISKSGASNSMANWSALPGVPRPF